MNTNTWRPVVKLVWLDELKYKTFGTGKDKQKVAELLGRVVIEQRTRRRDEEGNLVPVQQFFLIKFRGKNAEIMDKYGRNVHTSGSNKGGFIARTMMIDADISLYTGKAKLASELELEFPVGNKTMEVAVEAGTLVEVEDRVILNCHTFRFLDYIPQQDDEEEKAAPAKAKGKATAKATAKTTATTKGKAKASIPVPSDDEDEDEIAVDIDEDELDYDEFADDDDDDDDMPF